MNNKAFITILLTVIISMVGTNAFAFSIIINNDDGTTFCYNWINNKTELEFTHHGDGMADFLDYHEPDWYYSGDIVIPETVEYNGKTYYVTGIDDFAFAGCKNLESITIPSSVTYIGENAFYEPRGLTSVHISDISAWCKITFYDNPLLYAPHLFLNGSEIKDLVIPNDMTSNVDRAFAGYSGSLNSIRVEGGNTNYDSRNNCNAVIDGNNKLILGCKNTTIPNSVTSIGSYAFYGCSGLTSINIPDNVISIEENAFMCSGLVYIILPPNLASIGGEALSWSNLTDIYCKAKIVPSAYSSSFSNEGNITLHVPVDSYNAYKSTEPWNKFGNYSELSSSDLQASEKCSKPTISFVDGKIVFSCETQDVEYRWSIQMPSGTKGRSHSVWSPALTVFATKSGCLPSDVAIYEFSGLAGDVDGNGVVNVADHVKLSDIIMNQQE